MGSRAEIARESRGGGDGTLPQIDYRKIPHHQRNGKTPLQRFAEKCAFDPLTGCVMWVGGRTTGHGHSKPYGRFYDSETGEMCLAHRWSAKNIHGFEIDGLQVDHNCPCGPTTLCVEHVRPETAQINRTLQHTRPGRAFQSLETKRYWLFVQKGLSQMPPRPAIELDVPFYIAPAWLAPFLVRENSDDCPF